MFHSAVTVSLVSEARGGPFVFWDDLAHACATAAGLGFEAVEVFAPGPDGIDTGLLRDLLQENHLKVAAVGTGAGMVLHGLRLTDPAAERRVAAREFVRGMIDLGAWFKAPAIIGSMQGRWGGELTRDQALEHLRNALNELGSHAAAHGIPLLYEPLNRYESNLIQTVADAVSFLQTLDTKNVKLLADLFHMNIEERNVPEAILAGGQHIGHVHFVDSNRRAAGMGHLPWTEIAEALHKIHYHGYLSAEAFPYPDSTSAARQTIETYQRFFT